MLKATCTIFENIKLSSSASRITVGGMSKTAEFRKLHLPGGRFPKILSSSPSPPRMMMGIFIQ
jgi:hypothetical protein